MLELLAERAKCLGIIDNRTRKLDFLQKNKLIYAFQPNIIRNKKFTKYLPWFELADKTRNKLNEKSWFDEYLKDQIFVEIIKRINTETFVQSDWEYIDKNEDSREKVKRFEQVYIEEGMEMGMEKGMEMGMEKGIEKGIPQGEIIKARKIAKEMKARGFVIDVIAELTNLSIEEIEKL